MSDDDDDDIELDRERAEQDAEHERVAQEIFAALERAPLGIVKRVLAKAFDAFGLEELAMALPAMDDLADPAHAGWRWRVLELYGPLRPTAHDDGGGEWLEAQEQEDAEREIERFIDFARDGDLDDRAEYARWRASAILLRRHLGLRLAIEMLDDELTRSVLAVWPDPAAND